MTRVLIAAALVLLAGCIATPAPQFMGATRSEVRDGGLTYTIFRKEDRFQVVRTGRVPLRELDGAKAAMLRAVAADTGCAVDRDSVSGDAADLRGRLLCRQAIAGP